MGKSGVEQESERIRLAEDDETASPNKGYLHARLPVETDSIQVADPAKVAAGLKSVLKVAEFTLKGPGLVRGIGASRTSESVRRNRLPRMRLARS